MAPLSLIPPPLEIPITDGKVMPNRWQRFFLGIESVIIDIGNLGNLAALTGTGFVAKISPSNWAVRTLIQGTGITITNANGVAGNPTISATNSVSIAQVAARVALGV